MTTPSRPGAIATSLAALVRTLMGSPAVADSSTLSDGNFEPASVAAINCAGWRTVALYGVFTAGTAPTWSLQPLTRAGAAGAQLWTFSSALGAVPGLQLVVVEAQGRLLFPRVDAITGSPTELKLYVMGWEPLGRYDGPSVG